MLRYFLSWVMAGFLFVSGAYAQKYSIVVHGGAGNGLLPKNFNAKQIDQYHQSLARALRRGEAVLDSGLSARAAVVAVLRVLEDDSLFNAGRGAVLSYEGEAQLDASLMDGQNLAAGAVASVRSVRHPISAAEAVLLHSPHVLLSGAGADSFAALQGLEKVSPDFFSTQKSRRSLERFRKKVGRLDSSQGNDFKMGTVGCVVRDAEGNIAAGTSTGGMTGKRYGRIGDSPLIGAGTYADNRSVGVSCTGHGEYFIRYAIAHNLHSRVFLNVQDTRAAAKELMHRVLAKAGGNGGLIAIDYRGEIVMEFNTRGMLRGYLREGEAPITAIFAQREEGGKTD